MDPDFVMSRSDMGRKLLFAFSEYEAEQEKKAREKTERERKKGKRGGR
jgi:hypothetical protein